MNIMFGFRTLDPDPSGPRRLVEGVRIYPYDEPTSRRRRGSSPRTGRPWTGDQPRGLEYWVRLHDIYQREIVDERDRFYLAMLKQLGIEKGKPFEPDERLIAILTKATAAGELMAQANTFAKRFDGSRYWPDRQWDLAIVLDNSSQRGEYYDELLERASWFYEAVSFSAAMKSQTPGVGPGLPGRVHRRQRRVARRRRRLHAARSGRSAGQALLVGDRVRRRHPVPDRQRAAARRPRIPRRRPRPQRRRLGRPVVRSHGTAGKESNWVQTIPGKHWFSYFRFYGPLEAYFDRTWKLGDITPA